ncbi:YihY/virulence factor BrkB family protein [Pelagimonas varians]|uniref:Uncharacterized protein n=1 Tax=Pelagimonas varians TaxID=696760 RepID=A0A238KWI1_9RHOB|nr:YihY/virulence factor BrkB family protein [Pelagimonas varians]PYG28008.1 membrane protein [Pelagimonas varians]SMX47067.1 ribonuclease BN/unknown domain fusion protein [Pelagimonas varians]
MTKSANFDVRRSIAVNLYLRAFKDAIVRFDDKKGWQRSSHIALSMMFALFPFCIFVLALAGVSSSGLDSQKVINLVFGAWPDVFAAPIVKELSAVLHQSDGKTLTFSGLLAVFFASNGVDAIRVSITDAYREVDTRPFWKTRLLCISFVVAGGGILIAVAAFLFAIPLYLDLLDATKMNLVPLGFRDWKTPWLGALVLLIIALVACHKWLPGVHRPVKDLLPGVLLTVLLWFLIAKIFETYLVHFSTYSVTYAGLAGIVATQLFMYLMAVIFVYGAEFNGRLAELKAKAKTA